MDVTKLINAYDLYKLEQADELLETGLHSLDTLLGGGISPSTFIEIVGLSGTGKSQLCVYVDTEGGFHTKRICDIATAVLRSVEPLESLKRIQVSRCRDLVELMSTIHRLELLVQQNPKIGLIIVDSVAMPLRGENDYALLSRLEISRILSKSHRPNVRLWLCPPDINSQNNSIFLAKSPSVKNGSISFKITEHGLMEIERDIVM
ncbi:BMA-HUS-1 [Dirofilaria immitis]|nr:BMA-HUS-1 [Dirofilaria immitis]